MMGIPLLALPPGSRTPYMIGQLEGERIEILGGHTVLRILASGSETDGRLAVYYATAPPSDACGFSPQPEAYNAFIVTKGYLSKYSLNRMEHPAKEISGVIKALTQGSPEQQKSTLTTYFLPDATFSHPFCHVPSFPEGSIPFARDLNSRWMILGIYRWYRTLSPRIELTIDSAAFDQSTGILYVSIRQTFAVWFIPIYKAPVRLVSVLQLARRTPPTQEDDDKVGPRRNSTSSITSGHHYSRSKYYISSQEDLYQLTDCLQFLLPGIGPALWSVWQICSTWFCVMGSLFFFPVYLLLNRTFKRE